MELKLCFRYSRTNCSVILNDRELYFTAGSVFFLTDKISLFRSSDKKQIAEISYRIFPPKIQIVLKEKEVIRLRLADMQIAGEKCLLGNDLYQTYQHHSGRRSIYKNQKQVAYQATHLENSSVDGTFPLRNKYAKYRIDNYTIVADDDSDVEFIISLCLLDRLTNDNRSFPKEWEKKSFDALWQPK